MCVFDDGQLTFNILKLFFPAKQKTNYCEIETSVIRKRKLLVHNEIKMVRTLRVIEEVM